MTYLNHSPFSRTFKPVSTVLVISGDADNIPDPKVKKLVHAQLN